MASSAFVDSLVARRMFDNVAERRLAKMFETKDDPARILSIPPRMARSKKPTQISRSHVHTVAAVLLLGAIVISGIAAIIGLRDLGAEFGVTWIGDQ